MILKTPDGIQHDLSLTSEAEGRLHEIAIVNSMKAPELMKLFSRTCFELGRTLPSVYSGYQLAQRATANRKAVMIVDVVPGIIAAKKLDKNETTRQALLDLDPEYSQLVQKENEYEALVMYVRRKLEDMESALSVVKKIYGETSAMNIRPNYNQFETQFEAQYVKPDPDTSSISSTTPSGFKIGKPKY